MEIEIGCFKFNKVLETFPDERDITFKLIEEFVSNESKRNDEDQ